MTQFPKVDGFIDKPTKRFWVGNKSKRIHLWIYELFVWPTVVINLSMKRPSPSLKKKKIYISHFYDFPVTLVTRMLLPFHSCHLQLINLIPPWRHVSLVWFSCTRLTWCAIVIQFDWTMHYFFCFGMLKPHMSAVCVVFGAAPHYLTLSFCDDSQAPTLGSAAQGTGRDVIWIQQQSGGDGGKRAVYFKISLHHWLGLSETI